MSKLRYISAKLLEQHAINRRLGECAEPDNSIAIMKRLVKRAGQTALSISAFTELQADLHEGLSLRAIAYRRQSSTATECRRRKQELHRMRLGVIAVQLHDNLRRDGGATIDPATGFALRIEHGYLVSVRDFGRSMSTLPTPDQVFSWLMDHATALDVHFPGSWRSRSTGLFWLDMNRWFESRSDAIVFGALQGEEAFFDLSRQESIALPRPLEDDGAAA
jgi:hypothetical protein